MNSRKSSNEKRWVYGTRIEKWVLVDHTDRDFSQGITQEEMLKIGQEAAKIKYLSPSILG